jgi:hypothetical protein
MRRAALTIVMAFVWASSFWLGMVFEHDATAQSVVGTWRSQIQTPYGILYGETILMPNGRFSKTARLNDMSTLDLGTYQVGSGYIHFTITDHEPKVYRGKVMTWVKSETTFFQFVGQNRMICNDRITGTRWEAVRIR